LSIRASFFFTMIYPVKTPSILRKIYPSLTWHKSREKRILYLTFDDGPSPGITDEVLKILGEHDVKACFFLIGDKIQKFPQVYNSLVENGHQIGNHTYHHLNGWKTSTEAYLDNFHRCAELIQSNLFRPPHGRIKSSQIKLLKDQEIIMWDVLSGDFDPKLSGQDCLNNLIENVENGSIIVMHDSEKAKEKVLFALPKFLKWAKQQEYEFGLL